ncbi:cholesterol 25-hydroxylase [Fukomys damarensis]|uniref:Cholesterol 25-hydroxylase n=1 Tax=Fukomys damarensis TaxID=885580 RepID=A0A091CUQ6_FUKDA|nr:cholesterol 25-hydroxylase [Fukomys damarensis]KFO23289.1 Cholesterol 25-hydroxylase [Fukomys damarensis]
MSDHNSSEPQVLCSSDRPLLQPLWDRVRTWEALVQSPLFPVIFAIVTYLGFCLPFVVLDFLCPRVPALRRYKIHPDFSPSARQLLPCLGQTLYQHLVFVFPVTLLHWVCSPALLPPQAPELLQLLRDLLLCLLLFDAEFFAWHVLHHKVPWLYRTFHKVHHQNASLFALATQYMSVWELFSLGFFDLVNVRLLRCHPLTVLTFHVVNIWLSVEDHSGYDFPWSTHRLVPFGWYGGVAHHDLHHSQFNCNFAPYFTHWDKILGTLRAAPLPAWCCSCGGCSSNSGLLCDSRLNQKKHS